MNSRPRLLLLVLASCLALLLLWATDWPLGVPGQWQWDRCTWNAFEFVIAAATAVLAGAVYLVVVERGSRKVDTAGCRRPSVWLAALTGASLLWLFWLQSALLPPVGLGKGAWVLFYPASSGYFTLARDNQSRFSAFLADYEKLMQQGDVLHIGTHPPGLVLLHWSALRLCKNPIIRRLVEMTEPDSYVESCEVIEQIEGNRNFTPSAQAALWLVILLTHVVAVLTVFPLFWLVEDTAGRRAAWRGACFWPTVPSLLVFLPKSDALYPALALLFLWSWRKADREVSVRHAILAGAVFWVGMLLSLAVLPALVAATVMTALRRWAVGGRPNRNVRRIRWIVGGAAVGAFLALCMMFWGVAKVNLFEIWWYNYKNHAAFYDQFPRTYWKWLLVNPIELAIGLGVPAAGLSLFGFFKLIRAMVVTEIPCAPDGTPAESRHPNMCRVSRVMRSLLGSLRGLWRQPRSTSTNFRRFTWTESADLLSLPLGLLLLWLSGKNMGEAARLWLVVMPWPLVLTAFAWDDLYDTADDRMASTEEQQACRSRTVHWLWMLVIQMAFCFATAACIDGFGLHRLMKGTGH